MMTEQERRLAISVIRQVKPGKAADRVLRETLSKTKRGEVDGGRVAAAVFQYFRWRGLIEPNGSLSRQLRQADRWAKVTEREVEAMALDELRGVVPDWVSGQFEVTVEWIRSLQRRPLLWIRSREAWLQRIHDELGELEAAVEGPGPTAFLYRGEADLHKTHAFRDGGFEIQDLNSQWVGALCGPRPGETWWDVCAGEGGKFLDLADRMGGKGMIWATDRSQRRLDALRRRAARAKVFNYRRRQADVTTGLPFKVMFDGVLVDAPCSGLGTWQRNPDARWTTFENDVTELAEIQQTMLQKVARQVKHGGRLIYAVCTLTKAETDGVADWADAHLEGFQADDDMRVQVPSLGAHSQPGRYWFWPQDNGGNGMFVSVWRRSEEGP